MGPMPQRLYHATKSRSNPSQSDPLRIMVESRAPFFGSEVGAASYPLEGMPVHGCYEYRLRYFLLLHALLVKAWLRQACLQCFSNELSGR